MFSTIQYISLNFIHSTISSTHFFFPSVPSSPTFYAHTHRIDTIYGPALSQSKQVLFNNAPPNARSHQIVAPVGTVCRLALEEASLDFPSIVARPPLIRGRYFPPFSSVTHWRRFTFSFPSYPLFLSSSVHVSSFE
eukprot:Phypoly_transcript_16636.p2 GENE.Phypoly_transcript_16636~~Phypoly_transcript_16636.p2  ORF type:complete len:136 (-),score=17.84 Phypoly_transcript_16636:79-486(-)